MVRAGLAIVVSGFAVAVFGSALFSLMVLLTPGDEAPDNFDELLRVGLGLGGVLVACGLLVAAVGAIFHHLHRRAGWKP
jgi:hypothetical protein